MAKRTLDPAERPLVAVMIAEPLLDGEGGAMGVTEQVPWRRVPAALEEALRGAPLHLELHLLSFQRALEVAARADVLLLLCAGLPGGLAFEEERGGRLRLARLREELPAIFSTAGPRAVLLLGPHTAEAAEALHRLGVPVTLGIDEVPDGPELAALAAAFLRGLLSGRAPGAAARLARTACGRGDLVRVCGEADAPPRLLRAGDDGAFCDAAPTVELLGREGELAQLLALLEAPGLVQLSGGAGVGKTELARALLQRCRLARWPAAGTTLLDLRARPLAALLGALRENGEERATPEAAGRQLGGSGRLIVIEHVPARALDPGEAPASPWAAADSERAPGAGLPAETGRGPGTEPPGEEVLALLPALLGAALEQGKARVLLVTDAVLPLPGALLRLGPLRPAGRGRALLSTPRDRAGAWDRRDGDEADAELLEALDGHPLALRLAAAQLGDGQPPARVLRALREQGDLLPPVGGRPGLAAALAPARARLDGERPRAAELLRLVAELPAGLPAEAPLSSEDEADLLALQRENLLELHRGGYCCAGPVAAYALRRCPEASAERRAALLGAAAAALGAELRRQAPLLGTTRAGGALSMLSRWLPLVDWLLEERAPAAGSPDLPVLGELLDGAAELCRHGGRREALQRWCRAAGRWPESAQGPAVGLRRAEAALDRGDGEEARAAAMLALAGATRQERPATAARALLCLSRLMGVEGKREGAAARAAQALQLLRRAGDHAGEAQALLRLAELEDDREPAAARERCQAALALGRRHGDGRSVSAALRGLATAALRRGRRVEATELAAAALREARAVCSAEEEAAAQLLLGEAALAEGEEVTDDGAEELQQEAHGRFEEALACFRALGEGAGEARALVGLGRLALLAGRPRQATALGEQALGALSLAGPPGPGPGTRAQAQLLIAEAQTALSTELMAERLAAGVRSAPPRTPRADLEDRVR